MLVSHATVAQQRLSPYQAYTGFMLTALWMAHNGDAIFATKAFDAAKRYR